jgi:Mycobacterial 4 TMS phage holin, superfamily IV
MLARWGINLGMSLLGIAVGLLICAALLGDDFDINTQGVIFATIVFWIVHLILNFLALRILVREPSVALAGLLALVSTIVALLIVNWIVDDIAISGTMTYVFATLIIWITTAVADFMGTRMVRARRAAN